MLLIAIKKLIAVKKLNAVKKLIAVKKLMLKGFYINVIKVLIVISFSMKQVRNESEMSMK